MVDRLLFRPPPMLAEADLTHRVYIRVYIASMFRDQERFNARVSHQRYVDLTN